MRDMLIIGNWKTYIATSKDAKALLASTKRVAAMSRAKIIVAPPFPYIGLLATGKKSKVGLAAQDMSESAVGNATGEVSGEVLKSLGISHVIVGHSERRARGESDMVVAAKVRRALSTGLIPILCIGESERDHDAKYLQFLKGQLDAAIKPLAPKDRARVVIAYEPIWAIGKTANDSASPHDVAEMMLYIRKLLREHVSEKEAARATILYGGSVEPENAHALRKSGHVDGFLVGHASADSKMFAALIKAAS